LISIDTGLFCIDANIQMNANYTNKKFMRPLLMTKVLIAGLGNPGEKYEMLRHNVGARIVSEFIKGKILAERIKIYLPSVFMNESGQALKALITKEKIAPRRLLAVHDDSDIFFGKFKLSFGSRSAGHRGAESVIQSLDTKDFWRLRIGIQPAPHQSPEQELSAVYGAGKHGTGQVGVLRHIRADDLVLKPFSAAEEAELPRIIEAVAGAIEAWVEKNE
jgi:PTH1 family peptidyl-tRNA hydrolase